MDGTGTIRELLNREDLTMEELVENAGELLRSVAPRQTRYKVTDRPDARTIRYYINQGLIPKPISYAGGRARYSGRHVIRLLAIKKLQADHLTLTKIKSLLAETSEEEVLGITAGAPEPVIEPMPTGAALAPAPSEVEPCMRFRLAGGGSVDVPQQALEHPKSRERIITQLHAIARVIKDAGDKGGQP